MMNNNGHRHSASIHILNKSVLRF